MGIVSNQDLIEAIAKHKKCIGRATNRYKKFLTKDEIKNCSIRAIWYFLQKYGQETTKGLLTCIRWYCRNEIKRKYHAKMKHGLVSLSYLEDNIEYITSDDRLYVKEQLDKLSKWQKEIIINRFCDKMTFNEIGLLHGYSKQNAIKRFNYAMSKLKDICLKSGV